MSILVVDIGGSFIKYAVMEDDNSILSRGKIPTPCGSRLELVEALSGLYDANGPVDGLAISMPGIIDSARGYCAMGGALRYNDDFFLADALAEHIPVPIYMENDAKCAAMAEASVGSLKDAANGLVLVFGTMVGSGIIIDHKLYKGSRFSAGEVSYIIPRVDLEPGFDNVWGNSCGTPRLCRMYAEKKGLSPEDVTGEVVFEALHSGDTAAEESLLQYTKEIAVQIFSLHNILDPELIAIGGGISAQPLFIEFIRQNLELLYEQCPFKLPHARIVPCAFLSDANLIGALQCYLRARQEAEWT